MNKLILKTEFGSIVYGSSVPTSDTDYKGVCLPTAEEILLQRTPKTIQDNTKKDSTQKNTKDDVDIEIFGAQQYLKYLLDGQTPCLDLLFTPKKHWIHHNYIWEDIVDLKGKWLSNNVKPFIGYVKTQAAKYGIKGSRMGSLETTLNLVKTFDPTKRLGEYQLDTLKGIEHIDFPMLQNAQKTGLEPHLEVCNRKFAFHLKVKYVVERLQQIYDEYGHRAKMAKLNQGIDWKALYHAVRVGKEAHELLTTGNITFPRPEAKLLLKIRKGEKTYDEVADIIENNLSSVEEVKSILPDKPDFKFADKFIKEIHQNIVTQDYFNIIDDVLGK